MNNKAMKNTITLPKVKNAGFPYEQSSTQLIYKETCSQKDNIELYKSETVQRWAINKEQPTLKLKNK